MANISITRRCRSGCRYCFARHEMNRDAAADMPPEIFAAALRFLQSAGIGEVRLLGGEPTEHPQFVAYVDRARRQGFRVIVFSGGLIPAPALAFMAGIPSDRISVVLNTADPTEDPALLARRQREVCRRLGTRVTLGVNIRSAHQQTAHLFEWIDRYGVQRRIRMGIAHPIWGASNEYFRIRGPRTIPLLERIVTEAGQRMVAVDFDCGFTPCMFSREFVEGHPELFTHPVPGPPAANRTPDLNDGSSGHDRPGHSIAAEAVGMRCAPIVDILPEGDCIACYALSRFRRFPLPANGGRDDLVDAFNQQLLPVLPLGLHRECAFCDHREKGVCGGGCRARRALRLRPDAATALDPAPNEKGIVA
jgi:hypothetical protein